ncbi:uncharacterized protein LOC130809020 isoform X2 [Amaranthus tricolor]|uniref:uncharacterized protein LOC130809020 isoform X2 n=1 Tax=Amaranthus tricolor TaxID=29722 RepID=UPI002588D83C|nr:uncharacterized protein LOC130809020 isoform X2 [Amaranthus tricolor]
MVKRFFNGGSTPSNSIVNDALITLLSGPPSCGKTSLLFQFAFNVVVQSESQGYVVFICNRRRFQTKPPFLSQGIDDSSPIFERIQIKYLDDYDDEGLKKYFSAFHLLNPFPLAVIIDDFGDFFLDSKTASCQLLLSDTHHGDSPRLLFLYKRWVSSIFTIQGESQGSGSFYLKHRVHAAGSDSRKMSAKYSIALQYLVLEGIVEDDAHL